LAEWVLPILISWVAATISGMAGRSLLILPIFSHLVGAKKAIPILTIAWTINTNLP
jgi:Na+/serine symporter